MSLLKMTTILFALLAMMTVNAYAFSDVEVAVLKDLQVQWSGSALRSNWTGEPDCKTWQGLECDEAGNLVSLRVKDANLTMIPGSINLLENLIELELSYDNIAIDRVPHLGDLQNLRMLDLSHNSITGPLPSQLAKLSLLLALRLDRNKFTGEIIKDYGDMPQLRRLDLAYNKLTGDVPEYVCDIVYLDITHNDFSSCPSCCTQVGCC
jgi:Leucine-rich repeat (LRR) protein